MDMTQWSYADAIATLAVNRSNSGPHMNISFACSHCNQKIDLPATAAGEQAMNAMFIDAVSAINHSIPFSSMPNFIQR
jgi:hypothetical protein